MGLIRAGDFILPLGESNLRMVINNPIFLDDALSGSYSYPINLPSSPESHVFFQFIHNPEAKVNTVQKFDATYEEEEKVLLRGSLVVKKASAIRYDINFALGLTELDDIKDKTLREVDMGGQRYVVDEFQTIQFNYTGALSGTVVLTGSFPINTLSVPFNTNIPTTLNDIKNAIDNAFSTAAPIGFAHYPGRTLEVTLGGAADLIIKCSYKGANPALNIACTSGHLTTVGSFLYGSTLSNTRWLDEMNGARVAPSDYPYVFFPVKNNDAGIISNTLTAVPSVIQNFWDFSGSDFVIDTPFFVTVLRNIISPFPRLEYIFKKLFEYANYKLVAGIFDDDEMKRLVLWTSYSPTFFYSYYTFLSGHGDSTQADYVQMEELMPKKTIMEFLNSFRKMFCLTYVPNHLNKTFVIHKNRDLLRSNRALDWSNKIIRNTTDVYVDTALTGFTLKNEADSNDSAIDEIRVDLSGFDKFPSVKTFADLPSFPSFPGYFILAKYAQAIILVEDENYWYKSNIVGSGWFGWTKFTEYLDDFTDGDASTEISTGADFVLQKTEIADATTANVTWKAPFVKEKLNPRDYYKEAAAFDNDFGLRYMFYRGMQPSSGSDYPMSTYDLKDYNDDPLAGTDQYTLNWYGTNGLYEKFHKEYINFRKHSENVEMFLDLNYNDISDLDLTKKIYINGSHYFIINIDIAFPIKTAARVMLTKISFQ